MSSSDATAPARRAIGDGHDADPHLAHHFDSMATQNHASRLGMWLFLGTEILLFAGLFLGYSVYRHFYHDTFKAASHHLNLVLGTVNTVVLISSSFTVAMAYYLVKKGNNKAAAGLLVFTILCALAFLCIKAFEYQHKFKEGALPGKWFHFHEMAGDPGRQHVLQVYFLSTGLHAFHVIVGMAILIWVLRRPSVATSTGPTTSPSSWAASTGTWSTWSGFFSSRSCT